MVGTMPYTLLTFQNFTGFSTCFFWPTFSRGSVKKYLKLPSIYKHFSISWFLKTTFNSFRDLETPSSIRMEECIDGKLHSTVNTLNDFVDWDELISVFFQVEFKEVNETVLELSVWHPFNSGVISHANGERFSPWNCDECADKYLLTSSLVSLP